MFDHVGVSVLDVESAKQFYLSVLAPLGIKLLHEYAPYAAGFGVTVSNMFLFIFYFDY